MVHVDLATIANVPESTRVLQLSGMFDAPVQEKATRRWVGQVPIDDPDRPWNVGLIVGPSGAGKSRVARQLFGDAVDVPMEWSPDRAVIDDFHEDLGIEAIAEACSRVGFNTIPAWMRPFHTLSNGEQFRVTLARRLLELPDPVAVDEFTSVVDRQVAQIGAYAVQKWARTHGRQFVGITCHDDLVEWLDPDWILEPATMDFSWRRLRRRRPELNVAVGPVPRSAWRQFAPFHYMSADLSSAAKCFGLWVGDTLAVFCGVLHFPHPKLKNLKRVSRVVTLPDWQGLGLAFVLLEKLGAAYRSLGYVFRNYPAHPSFIRAHDRSPRWVLIKRPGRFTKKNVGVTMTGTHGGRANAVFEYVGDAMPRHDAEQLIEGVIRPEGASHWKSNRRPGGRL